MTKILIAEDNATNRELFRELLEARGYTVDEACDGPEALRMLEQALPDILLLDIGMPVLDGFAVVACNQGEPSSGRFARARGYGVCHAGGPGTHPEFGVRWLSLKADQCKIACRGTRTTLEQAR